MKIALKALYWSLPFWVLALVLAMALNEGIHSNIFGVFPFAFVLLLPGYVLALILSPALFGGKETPLNLFVAIICLGQYAFFYFGLYLWAKRKERRAQIIEIRGEKYGGTTCPYCKAPFENTDEIVRCQWCGASHHGSCWDQTGRCSVFRCPGTAVIKKRSTDSGRP